MDPIATLRELLYATLCNDSERAEELAQALHDWLERGGFSPHAIPETTYQGWKNYATWAVHRSLTADAGADRLCRDLIRRAVATAATSVPVVKGIWTIDQARRHILAESLKDFVDLRSPLADEASVYSDLLGSALYGVDWHEIAEEFLERRMT